MYVRTYAVGTDITPQRYQELVEAIAQWFRESRPKVEPYDAAKYAVDCCLRGVQLKDGHSPWTKLALSSLASRIRVAAQFDMEAMQPVRNLKEPEKAAKPKVPLTKEQRQVKKLLDQDPLYAPLKDKTPESAEYGDNPQVFFTPAELIRRAKLRDAYIADFPQLRAVASQVKLDMLLDLTLLMDRLRLRQGRKQSVADVEKEITDITNKVVALEKALNIHPDQLSKQQREKEGGTIGEAVRRLEDANPLELRERWFAEELLMLFQMYHQPSPRNNMGGYQLDEVGLFGATRCRTCQCSKCGERNYAGLSIDEITEWLREKGLIREMVFKPESLKRRSAGDEDVTRAEMDAESAGNPADPAVD